MARVTKFCMGMPMRKDSLNGGTCHSSTSTSTRRFEGDMKALVLPVWSLWQARPISSSRYEIGRWAHFNVKLHLFKIVWLFHDLGQFWSKFHDSSTNSRNFKNSRNPGNPDNNLARGKNPWPFVLRDISSYLVFSRTRKRARFIVRSSINKASNYVIPESRSFQSLNCDF